MRRSNRTGNSKRPQFPIHRSSSKWTCRKRGTLFVRCLQANLIEGQRTWVDDRQAWEVDERKGREQKARAPQVSISRSAAQCCHTLAQSGHSLPSSCKHSGWSAATANRLAKRYGHFGQKALRDAMDVLGRREI